MSGAGFRLLFRCGGGGRLERCMELSESRVCDGELPRVTLLYWRERSSTRCAAAVVQCTS
jgi:hypothetical protein